MERISWTQEKLEEFVKVWQNAESVRDVAEHFGIANEYAKYRASRLRSKGVPLKKFITPGRDVDYKSLAKYAEKESK